MKKLIIVFTTFILILCLVSCGLTDPPILKHPDTLANVFVDYGYDSMYIDGHPERLIPVNIIYDESFYNEFSSLKLTLRDHNSVDELDEYYRLILSTETDTKQDSYLSFCGQYNEIAYAKVVINNYVYDIETNIELFNNFINFIFNFTFDYNNLSDEDFIYIINNNNCNIFNSLYYLDGNRYGRLISSSDSKEDAIRVGTRHFTDERISSSINRVTACDVIYESNLLYGIHVEWEVNGYNYSENVISIKKEIANITVPNVVYNDIESYNIYQNEENVQKDILFYLFFNRYFISNMIDYELSSDINTISLTIYYYNVIYGDWGLLDEYVLYKQVIILDQANHKVSFNDRVLLKKIYL